jgi:hypothetical protein
MKSITSLFKRTPPDPVKHLTAKDLEFGFKDNEGRSYYLINTQLGIGLEHFGKANEFTMWMAAGLHPTELKRLTKLGRETCEEAARGKKGALATLGWIFEEMDMREALVIHTELLYNFIACYYIREDEPLSEWIESIHAEKVEAFKDCVKTRTAYDFFQLPVLKNIAGISSMSPEEWNKHWQDSIREQKNLIKKVEYLTSELKSASVVKTSRKVSLS